MEFGYSMNSSYRNAVENLAVACNDKEVEMVKFIVLMLSEERLSDFIKWWILRIIGLLLLYISSERV